MKHCCEKIKKFFGYEIIGYNAWREIYAVYDDEGNGFTIKFCPFCGKKLVTKEVVK